jgi:hypothetical protein
VHSFAVSQKDDAQPAALALCNSTPPPDPPIGLSVLGLRVLDDPLDPCHIDRRPVWTQPHGIEVSRRLQAA